MAVHGKLSLNAEKGAYGGDWCSLIGALGGVFLLNGPVSDF